jgi:quercetin dioxygenase-like cupin family protein
MKYVKKIKPFSVEDRGTISRLLDDEANIVSILLITSKKGSIRANHYHKKDVHYIYLLEGKIEYSYIEPNSKNNKIKTVKVNEGHLIHTPSMVPHATKFLEDSVFLAFSIRPRNQKAYEKDTVRIDFIK